MQLQDKSHEDLKKQLKVKFVNEEGIDEGGVQKEFFQLAMRELIDPKYGMLFAKEAEQIINEKTVGVRLLTTISNPYSGMFKTNEESRLCWFAQNPLDDQLSLDEYNMVGRLIGLAIYNGIILDIHFPLALYKKLAMAADAQGDLRKLDELWELDDLWEIDPVCFYSLLYHRHLCNMLYPLFLVN